MGILIESWLYQHIYKDKITHEEEHQQVLTILSEIIETNKKPIAQQLWRYIHKSKLFIAKLKKQMYKI